jgi:hypothetical protein
VYPSENAFANMIFRLIDGDSGGKYSAEWDKTYTLLDSQRNADSMGPLFQALTINENNLNDRRVTGKRPQYIPSLVSLTNSRRCRGQVGRKLHNVDQEFGTG